MDGKVKSVAERMEKLIRGYVRRQRNVTEGMLEELNALAAEARTERLVKACPASVTFPSMELEIGEDGAMVSRLAVEQAMLKMACPRCGERPLYSESWVAWHTAQWAHYCADLDRERHNPVPAIQVADWKELAEPHVQPQPLIFRCEWLELYMEQYDRLRDEDAFRAPEICADAARKIVGRPPCDLPSCGCPVMLVTGIKPGQAWPQDRLNSRPPLTGSCGCTGRLVPDDGRQEPESGSQGIKEQECQNDDPGQPQEQHNEPEPPDTCTYGCLRDLVELVMRNSPKPNAIKLSPAGQEFFKELVEMLARQGVFGKLTTTKKGGD